MDYIANVENSEIDVSGIRTVLVQGDSSYPVIRFVLDPSLTGLSWRVRGTYTDSNIPVLSPEIVPVESATEITLDWSVSSDFTTYYGNMQLVVVGANDSGTVITKALGEVTIQRDYSIGTMAEITLNLFEQLFAQTESAISTHNANTSAHADKEKTSNKVTSISSASTDVQYPSAKATYGAISAHNSDAGAHAGLFGAVDVRLDAVETDITELQNTGVDTTARADIANIVYDKQTGNVFKRSLEPDASMFADYIGSHNPTNISAYGEFSKRLKSSSIVRLPFDDSNDASAYAFGFYYPMENSYGSYIISDLGLSAGDTISFGASVFCGTSINSSNIGLNIILTEYTSGGTYVKATQSVNTVQVASNIFTHIACAATLGATTAKIRIFFNLSRTLTSGQTVNVDVSNFFIAKGTKTAGIVVNDAELKEQNLFTGKKILLLGDSITADASRWLMKFMLKLAPLSYINVAVSGATWRDYAGTTAYDGVTFTGYQNVIGNQVQKVINNAYAAPNIIIVFAGTNDGLDTSAIETQYTSAGSYVDISSCDRKTWYGAIRWSVETLRTLYPSARIFLTTPLQCAESIHTYADQNAKSDKIKASANRLAVEYIDLCNGSNVHGYYETNGSNGKYLIDGLHPNASGSTRVADFIYNKIKTLY